MSATANSETYSGNGGVANLRPWKRGQSGNPNGRPAVPQLAEIRELAAAKSVRSLERLVELVESEDERVSLMAAKEVLNWAYGSPGKQDDGKADDRSLTINVIRYTSADAGNQSAPQLDAKAVSVRTLAISRDGGQEGTGGLP
jgi:hypothetical protein